MSKQCTWRLGGALLAGLALLVVTAETACAGPSDALYTEDFNGEMALMGEHRQAQTFLPLRHGHDYPGWTKQGADMPAHFVEHIPGNWALMLAANRAGQNVFTQEEGLAANEAGHTYTVSFDTGPGVYWGISQATAEGDQIAVALLRADDTVLTQHLVTPGKWRGRLTLENHMFSYRGGGSGPVRFRISPVYTSGVRFFGTIDHLQVFGSRADADQAVSERLALEAPARERMASSMAAMKDERYASLTPKYTFAETLPEQMAQLKTNPLMLRFAESRKRLAADRYRPLYHFVSPESQLNDPNGLCFWQGRWHLFYQAYPPDEFPDPADVPKRRQHWGHAVSEDLVHWRDLPYAIYPGTERMCFSGSTVVEDDRVVAFYPGIDAGQMVAIADDPLLLNWEKTGPVNCGVGDSCIWKEGDTYLGLTGRVLWASTNLQNWENLGEFFSDVEGSCPNFVPIGDKHMLLSFSHGEGGQYQLGDYDPAKRTFSAYAHGWFNHGKVSPGGVHAPSAAADGEGGVVNIFNINDGEHSRAWDQIMSVAQRLTLGPDRLLRIAPVAALESLRGQHWSVAERALPANEELVLSAIQGDSLDLALELDPQLARWVELRVLRSPGAEEYTSIKFFNFDRKLSVWYQTQSAIVLDGSNSSIRPDIWLRPPEQAPFSRGDEPLRLRVLVDRSVVEVFVNDRQYLAIRVYPGREDSLGVSLRAQGQEARLKQLDAWRMSSIWHEDDAGG